jgi:hypothetical protein
MGAFEQKYGIPAADAPSFEQKYGLEPKPAPAQNLAADETSTAVGDALARGDQELFAAMESGAPLTDVQRSRASTLEGDEFSRFGRVAKAAPRAIGAVTTEQFKKMVSGTKALWKNSKAESLRKRGPFFDPLDMDADLRPPSEKELELGGLMATDMEISASKDVRDARRASARAAAAVPAEATNFERNVIEGAGSGLASAAVILPSALLSPLSGGAAAIPGVAALSVGAGGSRYADLIDNAARRMEDPTAPMIDHETAKKSAVLLGGLEALTEGIPGATLVKKSPLGKKAVEFLLTDILGENISSVAGMVDDYRLQLRDDVTLDDLSDAIADTTLQTVVGGAVQLGAAQSIQKGAELANERAERRANDAIRADINAGANVPTGDELAANLEMSNAEEEAQLARPRLESPDYSQARTVVDSEGNARPETQTEEFHVEQARQRQAEARQRAGENLGAEAARQAAVPRLPAPDTSGSRILVDEEGAARHELTQEAVAVEEARKAQQQAMERSRRNLAQRVDRALDVPRLPAPDYSGAPIVVDDDGRARPQSQTEQFQAQQERDRRRDLGMGPTRVPLNDEQRLTHLALDAAKAGKANDKQAATLIEKKLAKINASKTLILLPAGRRMLKSLSEEADRERKTNAEADLSPVVPTASPPANGSGDASGASGAGREDAALKPFDPRLEDEDRKGSLEGARRDIGLWEKGGRLMRTDGDQGAVTGRTVHIASDLWKNRPATEGGSQISAEKAHDALDRLKKGEELSPSQQRFVSYLLDEQDAMKAAFEEQQKAEAPMHRAEIIEAIPDFESQPIDAQTITEKAKVAAQYATEDELEAALEAQDDAEAMRRLQRLIDRGWLQSQDVTGETDGQAPQQELAADPDESQGEPVASEESREAEVQGEDDPQDVGGEDELDADGKPVVDNRLEGLSDKEKLLAYVRHMRAKGAKSADDIKTGIWANTEFQEDFHKKGSISIGSGRTRERFKIKDLWKETEPREERDPTLPAEDASEPKDILGNRQFEEHSGIKLGDRVRTDGKHVGIVRRIFEIPGKTSKLGKKRTTETKVRAEVYWPTKKASESSEQDGGGSVQNVDIDKLKLATDPEVETAAPGAKGMARKRLDKAIGKYLQAKRPAVATSGKERERIVSYRTEAVTGLNAAIEDGADQAVTDFLNAEFEWAKKTLTDVYPGINWETLERESPADLDQPAKSGTSEDDDESEPPADENSAQDGDDGSPIEDVGEKIGGARKDTAVSTGPKGAKAAKPKDEDAGWRKRYIPAETAGRVDAQGRKVWTLLDKRKKGRHGMGNRSYGEFSSEQEAIDAIPLIEVARNHSVTHDGKGKYYIWRKTGERTRVRVVEQDFETGKEAMEYMATHAVEIIETQTSFGEEILPKPETVRRRGPGRRTGNAKGEHFLKDFGLRGVEFGNWNNQEERQEVMNHAYDALMDMAEVLGIPPKAVGLGGQLGLAFGARGHGLSGARAHYEPTYAVINLTKMSGAGTIGHEWFHALDHYFAQQDTKASSKRETDSRSGDQVFPDQSLDMLFASHGFRYANSGVREELRAAYTKLIKSMLEKAEQYVEDTQRTEKFVGETKKDLADQLQNIRNNIAKETQYGAKKGAASAEQLAAFDAIAEKLIAGESLATKFVLPATRVKGRNALSGAKWTNEALDSLSVILKAVRGRDGFHKDHGVLTSLRQYMTRYEQRLKLLADAQASTTKTKMVPTNYRMESKSIDQGRASQYWESPHEMAARAFQAYLEDKIGEQGNVSDFLSYGSHFVAPTPWGWKRVYPTGDERVAINKAFDEFTKTLEVFEADGRVMIREDSAEYGKVSEPVGTGSQLDLFVSKPALPASKRLFKALAKTNLVSVGKFQTGILVANDFRDIAHMVAPLRKSPQEKFLAIVLNGQKEVLGILQHQVGSDSGAGVEIWNVLGAITKFPGAKSVYFAHNHPGGNPMQSGADINITNTLTTMLKGSGIESKGMVVVAPGNKMASYYSGVGSYQDIHEPIRASARPLTIDVKERAFSRLPSAKPGVTLDTGVVLDSPKMAMAEVRDAMRQGVKNGVLVMNYRLRVVDVLEMSIEEMTTLRTGNKDTGMMRALGAFESANASNAVIFGYDKDAMQNLSGLLTQASVRVVDMFHQDTDGRLNAVIPEMRDGWFYAMGEREGTRLTKGAVESAIEPILLNVNDLGIDVIVASTPYHLPKELYNDLYDQGALELVKGVFIQDQNGPAIYLIASNIRNADHAREIVIHELAHYGIHKIMSAEDYAREMDRLWELVPDQVREAARKNQIDISGVVGRRTAAEEVVAYASERLVNGETLDVKERTWLKRIFDAVRRFLSKLWPKFAIADREIADILRNAMASLTSAQKQRAPEDRVIRKSESVDEPPKGEPVNLSNQNKLHLNINQTRRQWVKARVPTAWLMPQAPVHDFFSKQTAAEIQKATDENPPLLEWVQGQSGGFFEVIDGNHRVGAAKAAGIKEITVKYSVRPKGERGDMSWLFNREAPIFYSALLRAAQDSKTQKAGAAQWLATMRNTPGVKEEEVEWTGLKEWLESIGRPVTKQEVADFIAANQISVEEAVMGGGNLSPTRKKVDSLVVELTMLGFTPYIDMGIHTYEIDGVDDRQGRRYVYDSDSDRFFHEDDKGDFKFIEGVPAKKLRELNNFISEIDNNTLDDSMEGTRYEDYTTDGGEKYREMLLTLPHKPFSAEVLRKRKAIFEKWQPEIDAARAAFDAINNGQRDALRSTQREITARMNQAENARDKEANAVAPEHEQYRSAHWDEKNILAHVRFDERTDADGKRVLFIQEIQSDWHQGGRKHGYKVKPTDFKFISESEPLGKLRGARQYTFEWADGKTVQMIDESRELALEKIIEQTNRQASRVPDAPFKTTWPDLAFKRMVRWAAEHGFDRIAWNTGDMANEMLSIEDKVHHIDYKTKDGKYRLGIILQNSEEFGTEKEWMTADEVEELLGADIARKIINGEGQPGGDRKTLRGLDLKLGGAGNRGFYDKILPQMAAKIGKKWGAKVGRSKVDTQRPGISAHHEFVGPDHSLEQMRKVARDAGWGMDQKWISDAADRMEAGETFAKVMQGASPRIAKQFSGEMQVMDHLWVAVHSMDVTAAMRDAAMSGQPLFSRRWSANAMARGAAIRGGRRSFDLHDYGPWSSWWNYVVYQMQNKFYDLFRTQKELAAYRNMVNLPEAEDANMAQTLYHGRAEERASEFWEQFVEDKKHPGRRTLVKLMREAEKIGYGWGEVESWLYARHAKEANAQLLKVNDGDPTFNSGMSDAEADAILNSFQGAILDEIGAQVDAMTKWTRDNLVANGLESQDTVNAWEATYKHYVPLKGWQDDPDVEAMPRTGKGFDTGGKSKRRMGRTSKGDAILANVVAAAQASIIRAEKAKVGRALYEMVKGTDAPNLWTVDQVEYTKYVDPRTGLVRQVVNPNFVLAPNVVRVRINGEDFHITFNPQDESMARLAAAFKNLSNENMGRFLAVLHGINRFLSTINTTLTPEFVITNALRDVQTAMVAIGMTDAAALRTKVLANWKGAVRGIWSAERGNGAHPWAATWREFKLEGGKVGWLQHYDTAVSLEKELQGLVEPDGTVKMVAGGIKAVLKLVEDANMSVENAIRLATYKAAVDSGISKARAAEIAKNLTVNFNRKGNIGTAMNAWYLFYNAAVQGSSVVWGAVKNPKTRKIIYGITAAGIAMDIINRMTGGEGDDKEREYDKIPDYVKESNAIIMLPPGMHYTMPSGDKIAYLKIPLPYGFNTFYYTGTKLGGIVDHLLLGNKRVVKPMEDAAHIGMAFFNAFSPIGGQSGSPIQAGAPTIADPFVQVWENKSFSGNPLMPQPVPFDNSPPDSQRYFKSATQMARDMTAWLNEASGGSDISPGRIDISPETVDHFWDFALGGLGRFMSGVGSTVHDVVVTPEDLELKEVPFLRRIAGEIGDRFTQDKFYEHVSEIGYAHDEWEKALDMKRKSPEFLEQQAYTIDRYPVALEMIDDLRSTTRVIRKARKEMKRLESRAGSMNEEKRTERLKSEKSYIEKEMNDFNRRWNEVEDSKLGERQKGRDITGRVGPLVNGKAKRDAVASVREAGMPALAALLWELPMEPPKAIGEWYQRDSSRA